MIIADIAIAFAIIVIATVVLCIAIPFMEKKK